MTFLKSTILFGFLLTLLACGSDPAVSKGGDGKDDAGEQTDEDEGTEDEGEPAPTKKDAGSTSVPKDAGTTTNTPKDAGVSKPEVRDSGSSSPATDAGAAQGSDAGKPATSADAGTQGGGGITFPDLFPSASDAGTAPTTTSDGGTSTGGRDVNGPCKDLELFCFDPFDMFIFNPSDCFTCNGGKGCQGCAIPFAY